MKKVLIILLAVVAAAALAVLLVRPGGDSTSTEPTGLVRLLGVLTPKVDVAPADVAGTPCWDASGEGLVVPSGQACQTLLPERSTRLRLCLASGAVLRLRVQGVRFGPQDADRGGLDCPEGETFSLYDDTSVVQVFCAPTGTSCVLRLV